MTTRPPLPIRSSTTDSSGWLASRVLGAGSRPVEVSAHGHPLGAGKSQLRIALAVLLLEHRIPLVVFGLDSVDWIFAVLFVAPYLATLAGAA